MRVWGGGIYQPSDELTGGYDFYSLCDELGILAWSEMIFSDATYPLNDFLLESIAPEVRENVGRVNKHPSNVQWAGGNEIENIVIGINDTYANGTHYLDEVRGLIAHMIDWFLMIVRIVCILVPGLPVRPHLRGAEVCAVHRLLHYEWSAELGSARRKVREQDAWLYVRKHW